MHAFFLMTAVVSQLKFGQCYLECADVSMYLRPLGNQVRGPRGLGNGNPIILSDY